MDRVDIAGTGDIPLAHIGAIRQLFQHAQGQGLATEQVLGPMLAAEIESGHAPGYVPAIILVDALERAAAIMGRETFALEMSEGADMHGFGPLSALTGQCFSIQDALQQSERYMHLANGALTTRIERYGKVVRVERFCILAGSAGNRQMMDAALVLLMRAMRGILGQSWAPRSVELAHDGSSSRAVYRQVFRAPLSFGASHYAIELAAADFARRVAIPHPARREACEKDLAKSDLVHPADYLVQVKQRVRQQLAEGRVTVASVATAMGQTVRGLQRRLHARGTAYADVLHEQRIAIAEEYLSSTRQPNLSELAIRLTFQDATAASRFLRHHIGYGLRPRLRFPAR